MGVASTEFMQAAAAQASSLGIDPAMVFVAHPIQDRTDDELRALAEAALPGIVARLVAGGDGATGTAGATGASGAAGTPAG